MSRLPSTAQENSALQGGEQSANRRLADAIAELTAAALARYDDAAILAQPQEHLIATLRGAVRRELRRHHPDDIAATSPHQSAQVLTSHIIGEVRKRQAWAFERQLAREYGPLDPAIDESIAAQTVESDGVSVVSTLPLAHDKHSQSA